MIQKEGMSVLWEIIHLALSPANDLFCESLRVQYQHSEKSLTASFNNTYPTSGCCKNQFWLF